jgi:hypothetical protein
MTKPGIWVAASFCKDSRRLHDLPHVVCRHLLRYGVGGAAAGGARAATRDVARSVGVFFGFAIEFQFFGDEEAVRHLRAFMDTDDQRTAEACAELNMQTWVAALESAAMMQIGRPCHILRLPGTQTFVTAFGQGGADSPAAVIGFDLHVPPSLDYEKLVYGFSVWNLEIRHHLFYFRRLIDESLPLDVRWLNGYRFLEWHFVGDRANLSRSAEWRAFVERFDDLLAHGARPGQTAVSLLEEARALAAHAGLDDRPAEERQRDPHNAMEKTFGAVERMVMTVLNEHPARAGHPVRFEPRE